MFQLKKEESVKIGHWQISSGHLCGIRFKKERYFLVFSVAWCHGLLPTGTW